MSHYFLGEKDRRRVNNALNVIESGANFPFSSEFDVADAPDVHIVRAIDIESPTAEPNIPGREGIKLGYWPTAAVFKIVDGTEVGTYELEQVWLDDDETKPYTIPVYNLLESALAWKHYTAVREKNGDYIVQVSGGADGEFYLLAEDYYPGRDWVWGVKCSRSGVISSDVPRSYIKIHDWGKTGDRALQQAKIAYFTVNHYRAGELTFYNGPCITTLTACLSFPVGITPPAIILTPSSGEAPAATVGEAYSFNGIAGQGLDSAMVDAGPTNTSGVPVFGTSTLPPGLSITASSSTAMTISGTPTTAGTYYSLIRGRTTNAGNTCFVFRLIKFVVQDAA